MPPCVWGGDSGPHRTPRLTIFLHELAGGGGWGDPLRRDPEAVARDVRNELLSREAAERDYGVVLEPSGFSVDLGATDRLRLARGAVFEAGAAADRGGNV